MERPHLSSLSSALLHAAIASAGLAALATWAALIGACGGDSSSASERGSSRPQSGTPALEELKSDAQSTLESAKRLLAEKQAEFKKTSESKLAELQTKLAELKQKAAQAGDRARPELEKLTRELDLKRAQAATKLEQWKSTGADAWQSFTTQVDQALHDLDQRIDKALSKTK